MFSAAISAPAWKPRRSPRTPYSRRIFFALSTNVIDFMPIRGQVPYLELLSYIGKLSGMRIEPARDNLACQWSNIEAFSTLLGEPFKALQRFVDGGSPSLTRNDREAVMRRAMKGLQQEIDFAPNGDHEGKMRRRRDVCGLCPNGRPVRGQPRTDGMVSENRPSGWRGTRPSAN
jgi:hypothetical protein